MVRWHLMPFVPLFVQADPQAVETLGDTLAKKGNPKDARALWAKLAETSPAYAEKANLQKKLH